MSSTGGRGSEACKRFGREVIGHSAARTWRDGFFFFVRMDDASDYHCKTGEMNN